MKVNTVNVIEYAGDTLLGVVSFDNTPEGNQEAEEHYKKIILEHCVDCNEAELSSFIEDGYFEQGDYQIFIKHSS